ncbi:MAG: DegV family protein [Lachnospiraceae bacterium]|nr:DegV family protein [Lachnospiraceae bacterium]
MSNGYILSACTTMDLNLERAKARDIKYIRFHYEIDGKQYSDDFGETIPYKDFYAAMANGSDTKTSQLNAAEFEEFFTPFLDQGLDILHISLSTGISGVFNSARIAAEELRPKYPDRKIYVVDGLCASGGQGLFMETLADMRDEGKTVDELYSFAEEKKLYLHHWFFSTDLKYFVKGGRISKSSGFVGTLLNICPLMNVDVAGRLIPRAKVRTKKKVKLELLNRMIDHADNGLDYSGKCFITHSDCYEDAREVADMIEKTFKSLNGPVEIAYIGTTIGSHTGPGTVALFFWGDKRVD